ncbi:hypothetical protein Acor_03730 [Acrocarpospora corrugata]|uniref:(d)CMP kinase n=2 Tax=Acrocarpospora corrugata TaxID=35763 RepID=A0A5M3VRT2_9ACTN|nr:hypothetical protein Acor_03730 [Acrocarpospora corrugata]
MSFADLAARIRPLPPSCGPVRMVAVDGPGGSGKTTFAGRLSRALGRAQVVHSDDFPVPWDEEPGAWFARVESQVLAPLRRGEPGRFQRYDWPENNYAEWIDVPPAPVLILEGVSTARPGCPAAFRVWVETPRDRRLARGLERDGAGYAPQWHAWMAEEDHWFAGNPTRERSDLLVNGDPAAAHDPETEFVTL